MDGAADQIRKMLDICAKYNIGVLLDIHCLKGSQNGFDNGGKSSKVIWNLETLQNFSHWPVRDAEWIGLSYNYQTKKYAHINYANIMWSL
jgi:glucan 1,3-beta-glucosidase